jgi:hypothetical protein
MKLYFVDPLIKGSPKIVYKSQPFRDGVIDSKPSQSARTILI